MGAGSVKNLVIKCARQDIKYWNDTTKDCERRDKLLAVVKRTDGK